MTSTRMFNRRSLLRGAALALPLVSLVVLGRRARAADASANAPLLDPDSPPAKAVGYVEDAHAAGAAAQGNTCANCALYQGTYGSTAGPCQLFKDRTVKAAGWCKSWAPQM